MAEMPQLASAAYASSAFHLEEMQQMTERLVGTPAAALPRHANFIAMKNVARDANQEGIAKMANVTRRLALPALSNSTLNSLREQIRGIRQQRAQLLEEVARINVTASLTIEGAALETLRRFRLV